MDRLGSILAAACLALAGCSAPGALLVSQDDFVRQHALQELAEQSPDSQRKAVPALVAALNDNKTVVRRLAADSLAKIGPPAKDAVQGLIGALRDEDIQVRYLAIAALGNIGPDASPAVPALSKALKTAVGGIGLQLGRRDGNKLSGVPFPGRPADAAGLSADDWITEIDGRPTDGMTSAEAAELLRGTPGTKVALKARRAADLSETGYETERDVVVARGEVPAAAVCGAAAEALGKIGSSASAALPDLKEAASETIDSIRRPAQAAIKRIEFAR